ncbi:gated mechanosensitive channel [Neoconidiobolus thromboides FSU 785]|nr:gated mechanosensitive channel [Neoconidiobolus thromboides FSU 785]
MGGISPISNSKVIDILSKRLDENENLLNETNSYSAINETNLRDNNIEETGFASDFENIVTTFWSDFVDFMFASDVFSLGVGIIIGTTFTDAINSFVTDILTPPLGLLIADAAFENMFIVLRRGISNEPYNSVKQALEDGAITINFGYFLMSLLRFFLITFILFWLIKIYQVVKRSNEVLKKKKLLKKQKLILERFIDNTSNNDLVENPIQTSRLTQDTKNCEFCYQSIHLHAKKCPYCTSTLI